MASSRGSGASSNNAGDADADDLGLARLDLVLESYPMAKFHAELALRSNPSDDDQTLADRIIAIAQVQMAAASLPSPSSELKDWYAVLQLGTFDHNICTADTLSFNRRRLSQLLHPNHNRLPNASQSFDLVNQAYSVLSDAALKSEYHARFLSEAVAASKTFWTVCMRCYRLHEYERGHKGKRLRCQVCKNVFTAAELPVKPQVVEGTDWYHCVWGFFPIGFPGGYRFAQKGPQEEEEKAGPSGEKKRKVRVKQMARKTVGPPRARPHLGLKGVVCMKFMFLWMLHITLLSFGGKLGFYRNFKCT